MTATPASHPFEIREHDDGAVHVIAMRGELDLATAPRLCVRIDAARRAGFRRILLDLTTAEFCDSAGLRALIGSERELAAHGRRMAVAALDDSAVGRRSRSRARTSCSRSTRTATPPWRPSHRA